MQSIPPLRADLIVSESEVDGQSVVTIKDPIRGTFFRLRKPEYWLIRQFDGELLAESIATRFYEQFQLQIDANAVHAFAAKLDQLFFLENSRSEQALASAAHLSDARRPLIDRLLYIKLKAFKPGRFLDWLTSIYEPFHRQLVFMLMWLVAIVGLGLLVAHSGEFVVSLTTLFTVTNIAYLVLAMFVVIGLHEFAHAVLCRYYGGEVREIGFLLMYLQPCFYCDVSDAWLFPKKIQRLAVTWAGPFCQLLVMAAAIIVWRITVPGTAIAEFCRTVVLVSWVNFFFNFNPLIKLDGYYLLSDFLEIPNLRSKAFGYLKNVIQRRLLGWPVEQIVVTPRHRTIFLTYAILAGSFTFLLLAYTLWWLGSHVRAAWGSRGFVLYLLLLLVILSPKLVRLGKGFARHISYMGEWLKRPARFATYVAIFVVVLIAGIAIPLPHRVSGEVLVAPLSEFTLSFNTLGLLEQSLRRGGEKPEKQSTYLQVASTDMAALELTPIVSHGQKVHAGDTVAVLSSNQITSQIKEAQAELERLQGELALLKAPPKKERVDEAMAQVRAAKTALEQLKRDRDRIQELVTRNLEPKSKLEEANSACDVAQATLSNRESTLRLIKSPPRPEEETVLVSEMEKQEARLDFFRRQQSAQVILTPIDGVAMTHQTDGRILTVSSLETVELQIPVSDFDLSLVQIGQVVDVRVRSYPGRTFVGRVVRLPETAGNEALKDHTFPVTVVVENEEGLLHDGMSGYAKIEVGKDSFVSQAIRKSLSVLRVEFWSLW